MLLVISTVTYSLTYFVVGYSHPLIFQFHVLLVINTLRCSVPHPIKGSVPWCNMRIWFIVGDCFIEFKWQLCIKKIKRFMSWFQIFQFGRLTFFILFMETVRLPWVCVNKRYVMAAEMEAPHFPGNFRPHLNCNPRYYGLLWCPDSCLCRRPNCTIVKRVIWKPEIGTF